MGNNCLLVTFVNGYKRVPLPPAKIMPFIRSPPTILYHNNKPLRNVRVKFYFVQINNPACLVIVILPFFEIIDSTYSLNLDIFGPNISF